MSVRKPLSRQNIYKPLLGLILVVAILCAIYYLAIVPFKHKYAVEYLKRGDQHLLDRKFLAARVDYQKSLWLNSQSGAQSKIELADQVQLDYQLAKPFLTEQNERGQLAELKAAEAVPESLSSGMEQIQSLINNNQPYLAEIVAQTLVEMDSENADSWLYLGIARLQTARLTEMTAGCREQKLTSAKEAINQAATLDKSNELAAKYLREINNLL